MQQNNHIHVSDFSLNLFDLYHPHFFIPLIYNSSFSLTVMYFSFKTQIKHNIHIFIYQNTTVHLEAILKYVSTSSMYKTSCVCF